MQALTLQANIASKWVNIALIQFPDEEQLNITELEYFGEYVQEHFGVDDYHAATLNYPVNMFVDRDGPGWMRFLDDIIPSGASRRFWVSYLGIGDKSKAEQDFELLKHGTTAPVGNLRILESLPPEDPDPHAMARTFRVEEVKERATDFLEYAQRLGAAAGGATGAGGEAPKLLLRCTNNGNVWIDSYQDDPTNLDSFYLVKYPRNERRDIDCDVLRAEYHFYHELEAMGFEAIQTQGMRLIEGDRYPSLWLPRFDVVTVDGQVERLGLESVYSILQKQPGDFLDHKQTLVTLVEAISQSHMVTVQGFKFDAEAFVIEWVQRDLLNIAFGNSDNHGRNTSFLKGKGWIELAPIYDFAPMKADPEDVTRTITWGAGLEIGGEFNFAQIAAELAELADSSKLLTELKTTAGKLVGLKQRLADRGVPNTILDLPSIGFDYLDEKLTRWNLL
ncbi:type II toxin-antitoxin system HipA family toxin [Aliagarivorans taiwanensis]|uniref:type II toxin-antitoxin system HipA family toxin n=1 Tax=Aliagarivorans taiwanensis TaxID=561966 RepID=UPI00040BCDE8|nr:HipA domain-containing protein [Aliagarivorans taiwanensis]